jgi:carbamoylphosphate synthase small subunit
LLGNKDANEQLDKLKANRKKLEDILYNHYKTLYADLGDLDNIDDAIKNAERLSVNDIDTKALIDSIKTWYGKIKADHSKYRTEFYNKYKQYGSWKQTVTPGRFRGGEHKTRRSKTNGKRKTRKI